MATRIYQFWQEIKSSFWFIPVLITLILACLGTLIVQWDAYLLRTEHPLSQIMVFEHESLRMFLNTVAGSMITITGVVFSITILVLSQASNQYTSTILRNFMRDRANQFVLGIFVGIFVFTLLLGTNLPPVSNFLTSFSAYALTAIGVGSLIYFIHHTAISIQSTEIVDNVQDETLEGINHLYPELYIEREPIEEPTDLKKEIVSTETGYIKSISYSKILDLAVRYQTKMKIHKKVGEFVSKNEVLCFIEEKDNHDDQFYFEVNRAIFIGKYRVAQQDVAYGIQQFVEIALKGLSPANTDYNLVQTTIDYMGSCYVELIQRDLGASALFHEDEPMVFIKAETFASLLSLGLNSILESAQGRQVILEKINRTLEKIHAFAPSPERKKNLEPYLA